jgi:hypothetical protein
VELGGGWGYFEPSFGRFGVTKSILNQNVRNIVLVAIFAISLFSQLMPTNAKCYFANLRSVSS